MALTVLIGPARSGKSDIAVRLGRGHRGSVAFIATAEGRDDEMRERIRRHRVSRPDSWITIEEPMHLDAAIGAAPSDAMIIIDCLTLWISNMLESGANSAEIADAARMVAQLARDHDGPVVVVTNEVGAGIVPAVEIARAYRDILGQTNCIFAAAAERVFLVTAGRVLALTHLEEALDVAR